MNGMLHGSSKGYDAGLFIYRSGWGVTTWSKHLTRVPEQYCGAKFVAVIARQPYFREPSVLGLIATREESFWARGEIGSCFFLCIRLFFVF